MYSRVDEEKGTEFQSNEAFSMQQGAVKELGKPQHESASAARGARGQDGVVAEAGDRGVVGFHTRSRGKGERSHGTGNKK